jgi:hypothetical protein
MPPGFTQPVKFVCDYKQSTDARKRTGSFTAYYWYTAPISGEKFTSVKAARDHHDPSGGARRAFDDEAKEAAKEALAKEASKKASKEAAKPATEKRPRKLPGKRPSQVRASRLAT